MKGHGLGPPQIYTFGAVLVGLKEDLEEMIKTKLANRGEQVQALLAKLQVVTKLYF